MTLPARVRDLAAEVQLHKVEERRHRKEKRLKAAELEALCDRLGINYRRIGNGTAQGHSRPGSD